METLVVARMDVLRVVHGMMLAVMVQTMHAKTELLDLLNVKIDLNANGWRLVTTKKRR